MISRSHVVCIFQPHLGPRRRTTFLNIQFAFEFLFSWAAKLVQCILYHYNKTTKPVCPLSISPLRKKNHTEMPYNTTAIPPRKEVTGQNLLPRTCRQRSQGNKHYISCSGGGPVGKAWLTNFAILISFGRCSFIFSLEGQAHHCRRPGSEHVLYQRRLCHYSCCRRFSTSAP